MSPPKSIRRGAWLLPAFAVAALFLQVRHHDFVHFDDPAYTYENRVVSLGLTWEGLLWAFSGSHVGNYHPLTWLSYMIDVECFGMSPGSFALVNAGIHAANATLLAALFAALFRSHATGIVVGTVFAVHPQLVEAVAWIAQRKTVLSTFFFLVALLLYFDSRRTVLPWRSRLFYFGALGAFGLSLLAKSMYVTFPAVLLLMEMVDASFSPAGAEPVSHRRLGPLGDKRFWARLGPFAVLAIAFSILTFWAQSRESAVQDLSQMPLPDRLATMLHGYATYLRQFFVPSGLAFFYPPLEHWALSDVVFNAMVLLGVSLAAYRAIPRVGPIPFLGWLLFLGTMVPVIGLVQVGDQSSADRYMYGPILGLLLAASALARKALSSSQNLRCALVAVVAIWTAGGCVSAFRQVRTWRNSTVLASAAMENVGAHVHFLSIQAAILLREGRFREAVQLGRLAIRLSPTHTASLNNLAVAEFNTGNLDRAIELSRFVCQLAPRSATPHVNMAAFFADRFRWPEARAEILAARAIGSLSVSEDRLLAELEKKTERP